MQIDVSKGQKAHHTISGNILLFQINTDPKWVVQKLQSTAATEAVVTKFADFKIAQNFEHYVTKVTKVVTVIHSY